MKALIVALALCTSCKPACSAVDQLQTTYAADIAVLQELTGMPTQAVVDILAAACKLGGEAAVAQEIRNLESVARATQATERARR